MVEPPTHCSVCDTELDEPNWEGICETCEQYTVIIAVKGEVNGLTVPGIYSVSVHAEDQADALERGRDEFIENPPYNTDISVDKDIFPPDTWLDDWGYTKMSARAVVAKPASELSPYGILRFEDYKQEAMAALL